MTRLAILGLFALCAMTASASEDIEFTTIDADADGQISESEFVTWRTSLGNASPAEALVKFIEIDVDSSGSISEAELDAAKAVEMEAREQSNERMP